MKSDLEVEICSLIFNPNGIPPDFATPELLNS